ncbi:MAG: hypothetical protein ACE5EJ_01275 [Nitrosopumilaceae archaeon]
MILVSLLIPTYVFADEFQNNLGKIYWQDDLISLNSFATVYVEDMDMNKKEYPNYADKFKIKVWSDSFPDGIEIEVTETGIFTGIFKGRVYVADSSESSGIKIPVTQGDTIYALYIDETLPESYSNDSENLMAAAIIKIPGEDMTKYLNALDPILRSKTYEKKVPDWIKNNARWWAEGTISDTEFVLGIQFLVKEEILIVSQTQVSTEQQDNIPEWIKNNARWWAEGTISEDDFLNGIQYLIKVGIVSVTDSSKSESKAIDDAFIETNPEIANLKSELETCQEIKSAYKRLECEKQIKEKIELLQYKEKSTQYEIGPITFYYPGIGTLGNEFEINPSGRAILRIRILAENTGSDDNVTLFCSGPSICNYDVWNGQMAFKYSSTDFVSGQIVIKPKEARIFNMLFGPNIGYGGTEFEYDSSKDYFFRISEPWGSVQIPLNLQ